MNQQFLAKKIRFCKKHRQALNAVHSGIRSSKSSRGWWITPEIKKLIAYARRDIGYSPKTVDIDIINSLYKCSRSAVMAKNFVRYINS